MLVVLMIPGPTFLLFALAGMFPIAIFLVFFFETFVVAPILIGIPLIVVFVGAIVVAVISIMMISGQSV